MRTVTVNVPLPMTPQELAEARAEATRLEEDRQRRITAETNRAAGHALPTPGTSLFVSTARAIKQRFRAGVGFSPVPMEVKVIDADDTETLAKQRAGASVVNVDGAERILADSNNESGGLVVYLTKGDAAAVPLADQSDEVLEAEIARRRAAKREGSPDRTRSTNRELEGATTDRARGGNRPADDATKLDPKNDVTKLDPKK